MLLVTWTWSTITPRQIQHGWPPPSSKSIWRHISAVGGPIRTKFGSLTQNNTPISKKWSKTKPEVEFQYGGRLFFQNGSSYNTAVNWAMSTKFSLVIDFDFLQKWHQQLETGSSTEQPLPPSLKIDVTSYFATGGAIWMKFGTLVQNGMPITAIRSK